MKKYLQLIALLLSALALQSCGTKSKEGADATTTATVEPVAESKIAESPADRKARIEKARMEKLEQKRLAAIEKAKTSPTYKDASGKVIYYKAEVDPSYNGGEEAMMKYLRERTYLMHEQSTLKEKVAVERRQMPPLPNLWIPHWCMRILRVQQS